MDEEFQFKEKGELPMLHRSQSDGLLFKSSIDTIKKNIDINNQLISKFDLQSHFKDSQNLGEQKSNHNFGNYDEEHKIQINDKLDESAYFEAEQIGRKKSKQLKQLEYVQSLKDNLDIVKDNIVIKKKIILLQIAQMGMNFHLADYIILHYQIDLMQNTNEIIQQITDYIFKIEKNLENLKSERQQVDLILFDSSDGDDQIIQFDQQQQSNSVIDTFKKTFQIRSTFLFQNQRNPLYKFSKIQMTNKSSSLTNEIVDLQEVKIIEIPRTSQNKQTCLICLGELQQNVESLACNHKFCKNCTKEYLNNKIKISNVINIVCPFDGCKEIFQDQQIESIVDSVMYKNLLRFRLIKELEKDENIRWCIRPGCEKYMRGSLFTTVLTCECGQQICFVCRNQAHSGKTCEEAIDTNFKVVKSMLVIQNCPKCSVPIQKNEGCNHMTCFKCRFSFCWLCRARYTTNHYQSYNCFGCPGKQFVKFQPFQRQCYKKYGGIIAEAIFILPFWPIILFIKALQVPFKLYKKKNYLGYKNAGCCELFCLFLLALILSPIFIFLQIIPGLCIKLFDKIKYD